MRQEAIIRHILTLLKKDILLEFRQQYTFYGVLLYIASTIFVLYLALQQPDSTVWNGLFWMIQLFICVNAVAKSFLQETRGRMLYFYSISGAQQFIIAKLLYNTFIMLIMSVISLALFRALLGNPLLHFWQFTGIVCLGSVSLSLVFTMLAAIAAKAQQQASLMAIMGFPIIIPQLLLLMRISKAGMGEIFQAGALSDLVWLLCGLDVLVMVMAVILFPFLWRD
ncbi:MAG: heme exporter protein CcmB [Chitinophagaceae bacterium]|nr:heme exporter protein CcmB [Chitinophagaceae bacterium]